VVVEVCGPSAAHDVWCRTKRAAATYEPPKMRARTGMPETVRRGVRIRKKKRGGGARMMR